MSERIHVIYQRRDSPNGIGCFALVLNKDMRKGDPSNLSYLGISVHTGGSAEPHTLRRPNPHPFILVGRLRPTPFAAPTFTRSYW